MRPNDATGPSDARRMALFALNKVESSSATLDQVLEKHFGSDCMVSGRERALAAAIIYGVLRWRGRLDYIISHFSKTPLSRMNPEIRNILRIGLFQIAYLSRVPVSAAVNTAVEMTKTCAPPFITRFVNGVLRNAARAYQTVPFPSMATNPVHSLATIHSFPTWLIARWVERFGTEETTRMCEAVNTIPPLTIRVNSLKTSREILQKSLSTETESISPTPYSPDGIHLHGPAAAISDLQEFQAGSFQVQDEAAQLVTYLLDPHPGESILDACAGLGGKTAHIAERMQNSGNIIATDRSASKLDCLSADMKRLGITIVRPIVQDISLEFKAPVPNGFDRVLLDAPCSGLGVLRRNPDGKWSGTKKDLGRYQQHQQTLLQRLAPLVKPNGVLVYAVCSNEPEENETAVEMFLSKHPEFSIAPPAETFPCTARPLINSNGFLRTYPHHHRTDGFFGVRLRKSAVL